MNAVERFAYARLGVRKEYPGTNFLVAAGFIAAANIYAKRTGLTVEGSIPRYGETVFVSNHIEDLDALRFIYACVHAVKDENGQPALGRLMRGIAKSTLFGIGENEQIRARSGKKDLFNSNNPLARFFVRNFVGRPLKAIGIISVRRGLVDRAATGEINHSLDNGQGIAISLTETRDKTGGLNGIRPGVAALLQARPYTPFQVAAISRDPHVIRIGEPSTYAHVREEQGEMDIREFALFLADSNMNLQVDNIRNRWISEGREAAYQTLYAGQIQRAAKRNAGLASTE